MRMFRFGKILLYGLFFVITATGCNNFFHNLIPPNGDRIESFSIPGQLGVEIQDNTITIFIPPGMPLENIIPNIRVSSGATLFPVTRDYVARAFSDERSFGAAMEIYSGSNMTDQVVEMIRSNKDFIRPVVDIPINFNFPIDFLVISGQGSIRQYRVQVQEGGAEFRTFHFDKFYNPDLVRSAPGIIDRAARTVTLNVDYPVENIAQYKLIPSFSTNGARVILDGRELQSDISLIDFFRPPNSSDLSNPYYSQQTLNLSLRQAGLEDTDWTIIVNFSEDPNTSRAITDFRFTRTRNSLIAADTMAVIKDNGDTGTIEVTVYYSGARPTELRADFISPGTVTVQGATQVSGFTAHDFSVPLQYVVTSRIGNQVRTYTVNITLVEASDPLPVINSFTLSTAQNPGLSSNSIAMIDHAARLIVIEAAYSGDSPPLTLRPNFTATGEVTVNGAVQNSSTSSNNFSGPVFYTVSNPSPSNPTLRREYRVEVRFVKSLSSVAEITLFEFFRADNPGLIDDVKADIDPVTGAISATLLFETPGGNRTLIPRWSAQGTVQVGGITQTSGTGRQFYTPVQYRAISTDGFRKDYTVTIKEVNSRIYVRQSATGLNNGTNWQNAYRNLPEAAEDAELLPDNLAKEVWIAQGTYRPSNRGDVSDYLLLSPNTSWIGGFAGNEASVSARSNPNARRATITGDLGGGRFSERWFTTGFVPLWLDSYAPARINGDLSFEYMNFSDVKYFSGSGSINIVTSGGFITNLDDGNTLSITHCNFSNVEGTAGMGIILNHAGSGSDFKNFNVIMKNIDIQNNNLSNDAIFIQNGGNASYVKITDSRFRNTGAAIDIRSSGISEIENVTIEGSRSGLLFNYSSISYASIIRISNVTIKDMENVGIRATAPMGGRVEISNTTIENTAGTTGGGMQISGTTVVISDTRLINTRSRLHETNSNDTEGHGGGIRIDSNTGDTALISNVTFLNTRAVRLGGGISFVNIVYNLNGTYTINPGPGTLTIRDSRFENCTAGTAGGAIWPVSHPNITVINTEFINCSP